MDFSGRYQIPAPPDAVWAGLNDPAILAAAIPGCETLTKTGENDFTGTVTVKIGPMKISFKGKVSLSDPEPPSRLKLTGSGDGGVSGFAKGGADIALVPKDGGTELSYTARADIGGKLAQIGQRLIDGAARQLADQFFERFSTAVAPPAEPHPPSADQGTSATAPAAPETQAQPAQSRIWLLGLAGVLLVLAALFVLVL
jgi:carbon monoxide dehydrogenase subunit G